MKTIIIYPGGFHPFHKGHAESYNNLRNKFQGADLYVASSPSTAERPFSFEDKKTLAVAAGIPEDKFVMVKSPYRSEEITQNYDPEKDVLVFALSEKDSQRLSYTKKDGSVGYFQPYDDSEKMKPFKEHAYVYITPKVSFEVLGTSIDSASKIRDMYKNSSDEDKINILKDMYLNGNIKKIKSIFDSSLNEEFNEEFIETMDIEDLEKRMSGEGEPAKATDDLKEMIQKKGSQWVLRSKKTRKVLGKFPSKKKALKREKQIQYFKHMKEAKEIGKKLTRKEQNIENRLETLLRYGLVPKNLIARSRRALFDQKTAVKTPYLRDLLVDILDHVLKMVLDNPVLYHRLLRDVMVQGPIVKEETDNNNNNNIEIPSSVAEIATSGIELRKEFNRGGSSTIVKIAKKLSDSKEVDMKFIKKLNKSLKIHSPSQKEGWDDLDNPSNQYITWQLLGGNESVSWVEKIINTKEEE